MKQGHTSYELQIISSQIRSTFKDGNDATITKAFVCPIFVEVETARFLIIDKICIKLGKLFLDYLFALADSKGGRAIDAEATGINIYCVC